MLAAEITRSWHTDAARFHAGTYIGFASFAGEKQVEKIKIPAPLSGKNLFGHLSKATTLELQQNL